MTIIVTGTVTITTAQLIDPGGPIKCSGGSGTIITLPIDVHDFTGTPTSVTVTNTGTETQTVVFRDKKGREGETRTVGPGKRRPFSISKRKFEGVKQTRYFPGTEYKFFIDPDEEDIDSSSVERSLTRLGSSDQVRKSLRGTPLADVTVHPTGRPDYYGDEALGWIEFDPGDDANDFDQGAIAMRGVPIRPEGGIIIPQVVIEVTSGGPFVAPFPADGGMSPMVLFRAVGGASPPPAVAVSMELPLPADQVPGQEVYLTNPDELTGLTLTIEGGASFGGGSDASLDVATVTPGLIGRFWTDAVVWYVMSGATLA